jgi:hypothetical protein
MKKAIGVALILFGMLLLASASANARTASDISFLVGTYLPGIFFLAIGLLLKRDKTRDGQGEDESLDVLQASLRSNAEMGVVGGIVLMFFGSGVAQQSRPLLVFGSVIVLGGWALMIWGASAYMKWKGYSRWFGLGGLLLLPGLIILVCFPDRMKDTHDACGKEDKTRWGIAVATFVGLVAVPMTIFATLPFWLPPRSLATPSIAWAEVPSAHFKIEMPVGVKRKDIPKESPDGSLKTTVQLFESRDPEITYSAAFTPCHPDPDIVNNKTAFDGLFASVLDTYVTQLRGRLLYRKTVSLGKHPGFEQAVEFDASVLGGAAKPGTEIAICKAYLIKDTVTVLAVIFDRDKLDDAEVKQNIRRFFGSLNPD